MVAYMLVTDVLNRRQIETRRRMLIITSLVIGTSVMGIRLVLYPLADFAGMGWLQDTTLSILDFSDGLRPTLLFILVNTFLWVRVAIAADREISFFGIGVSFRLGMLLSLTGGALLITIGGQPASLSLLFFTLFFTYGLIAVALARIDEKAIGIANSIGSALPYPRLAEIGVLVSAILFSALALQSYLGPVTIRKALSVLDPLWKLLGWALAAVLISVLVLIGPLLERLVLALQRLAGDVEPIQPAFEPPLPADYIGVQTMIREYAALRYCLVTGAIVAVIALLWFLFIRTEDQTRSISYEEDAQGETSTQVAFSRPRLERLRDWLNLLRKYGISQRLLDAVTVQNMYANLGRLARKRGYPRRPSQPPDDYLPLLLCAFPGQGARLERITLAYMQVHYGDLSIESEELRTLRKDYARIVETPRSDPETDDLNGDGSTDQAGG
jgi:hypothetical protein